ncbi:MAG: MATE family efflux transporter [Chloroflexota bacterium]
MDRTLLLQRGARWLAALKFFADGEFFRQLFQIAMPIALQNLVMSSLGMVGGIMIGQLGDTAVAAVGLANQVYFLLQLLLFGITSGSAIFTAQLWGKRDVPNIHKVLGLCVLLGAAAGLAFMALSQAAPQAVLRLYSNDDAVIALGSEYLRIFGWSYIFIAITFSYAAVLRSTGNIRLPLLVSIAALGFNTALSYALIFGVLGLPAMGVNGAAWANLWARILECLGMLWFTYRLRTPAATPLRMIFHLDLSFIGKVMKPVLPVMLNELLWALGITTYNAIYARIGTEAFAAMNIVAAIDNMAFVFFFGVSSACSILVGNLIGADEKEKAHRYALRSLIVGLLGGLAVGGVLLLVAPYILSLYKVSATTIGYAQKILMVIAFSLWLRISNLILLLGALRSGGDTRFALVLDGFIIWLVGVPAAYLGAFVLHLPIYWVYLMVMSEEFTKWLFAMQRFFSKKWMHNLAQIV